MLGDEWIQIINTSLIKLQKFSEQILIFNIKFI